jgi:hypothetical protein
MTASKSLKQRIVATGLIIIALTVLGGIRLAQYREDPDVLFLCDRAGAQWIKYNTEFKLKSLLVGQRNCGFRYKFNTNAPIENARLTVQALKRCQVVLDGVSIFTSPYEFDKWKQIHDIALPSTVKAGSHEINIIVTSENSYSAVIAYSDTLPIRTGEGWLASIDSKTWEPAVPASMLNQAAVSREFPAVGEAFIKILPYLAIVFLIVFVLSLTNRLQKEKLPKSLQNLTEPSQVRWILLGLFAVLSVNNMFKINFQIGFDIKGHIEYIQYIVAKGSLPLAPDGWQMFQSPLNYIISAPVYALMVKWFDWPTVVKILRIIPIVCGLLQIEIVYRAARLVFPQRKDLQIIATITGALMPMHTYITQVVGNEPLAGCFISLLVLFCLKLVMPGQKEQPLRFFFLIGIVFGLALLSKVTAVMLAPVLVIVLLVHARSVQKPLQSAFIPIAIVFGISILISGWYYFRNYIELGSPFVGGWDPSRGIQWWQAPSYRTWTQLFSFGQSLTYPVYAGVKGFWDAIYTTLWLDGFNSGLIGFVNRPTWNVNFMIAGALLALIPTVFIFTSLLRLGPKAGARSRNAVIFSIGSILLFLAVMMDLYIRLPIYSPAKSTYTLGLLPCYAILTAAGAEPFLRNKIIRSLSIAAFSCWAFAAYAAYLVIYFQQ